MQGHLGGGSTDLSRSRTDNLEEKMSNCTLILILAGGLVLSGCQSATSSRTNTGDFGCLAGTVSGAILGGFAGSAIGAGSGQLWAVGGGATLGGAAGSALTCR